MDLVSNFRSSAGKIVSLAEYTAIGETIAQAALSPSELIQRELEKSKTIELISRGNHMIENDPAKLAHIASNAYVFSDKNLRTVMGLFVNGEYMASTCSFAIELERAEDKTNPELQDKMNAVAIEAFGSCKDYSGEAKSGILVQVYRAP